MFVIDQDFTPPCTTDPELFFDDHKHAIAKAKALCAGCKIRLICLHDALEFEKLSGTQLEGIQGGLTKAERANTTLERIS